MTTRSEEIAGEGPYTVRYDDGRYVLDGPTPTVGFWALEEWDAQDHADELNAAYARGQQDRWISVEERLPEPYQWVLVYSDTGGVGDLPYDIGRLVGKVWKCLGWDYPVTHWAPLPPNPEQR